MKTLFVGGCFRTLLVATLVLFPHSAVYPQMTEEETLSIHMEATIIDDKATFIRTFSGIATLSGFLTGQASVAGGIGTPGGFSDDQFDRQIANMILNNERFLALQTCVQNLSGGVASCGLHGFLVDGQGGLIGRGTWQVLAFDAELGGRLSFDVELNVECVRCSTR
jgi:hypothetical protein